MQNSSEKKNPDNFILGKKHSSWLFGTHNTSFFAMQYYNKLWTIYINVYIGKFIFKKPVAWLTKTLLIWQVKLEGSHPCGVVDSEEGYQLLPVSGSNLFFILKQRRLNDEDKCCTSKVRRTTYRKRVQYWVTRNCHPYVARHILPNLVLSLSQSVSVANVSCCDVTFLTRRENE